MPRRALAVLWWLATISLLSPQLARAECVTRTAQDVLQDSRIERVFSGTVTVVNRTAEFGYRATFAVDRVWKGTTSTPFAVYVYEGSPEVPRFETGRTYIVQARRLIDPDARRRVGVTTEDATVFSPIDCSDAFPPTLDNLRALGPDLSKQPVVLLAGCDNAQLVTLSIANVGSEDTAVMFGVTLGNGKYMVSALTLQAALSDGQINRFRYRPGDYPVRIGGRIDPWIVPLQVGATYTLHTSASQFMAANQAGGLGKRLTYWPNPAQISFELLLQKPESTNSDMIGLKVPNVWKGVEALTSNRITIPGDCR
jgi:hypothetical protein